MQALKSAWAGKSKTQTQAPFLVVQDERLVVAHFMLGNTYPFTEEDWTTTFDLAEDTALDGFALNLGPEEWQLSQAHSAFSVLASRPAAKRPLRLFLSMDMNVLPSSTTDEAQTFLDKVLAIMQREGYLRYQGRLLLSTFGGHDKGLGEWGWPGFLFHLQSALGERILFVPSFFMPPEPFIDLPYVDGCFAWNNAWPLDNRTIDLREDEPFLNSKKLYMAAVSPLFSTHYGSSGEWAFNKNWIYRSDDLLLPTRFSQLLALPPGQSPGIIQVISWNDHGESHAIAPVLGAEPGSQAWTKGMDHLAFREMVRYFADLWREGGRGDGSGRVMEEVNEVKEDEVRVWGWWRTHPALAVAEGDEVGMPSHAGWAEDLLNFMVLIPPQLKQAELVITNGPRVHRQKMKPGRANAMTVPFVPGPVGLEIVDGDGLAWKGQGREIDESIERYNFNMWTGSWAISLT